MAQNEYKEVDSFIKSSYEREKELNGELDYIHKLRHEMTELKADSSNIKQVDNVIIDYEESQISEVEAINRIKNIIRQEF